MSVKDFYNAVTPGSSLGHGIGRGVYKLIGTKDICSQEMLDEESLPSQSRHGMSVLNEVLLCRRKYAYLFQYSSCISFLIQNNNYMKKLDPKRGIVDL